MLLAAIAADGITASRLFAGAEDPVAQWRNSALLWRGQLTSEGRNGLVRQLDVDRAGRRPARDIRVQLERRWNIAKRLYLDWVYDPDDVDLVLPGQDFHWMSRKNVFTAAKGADVLEHSIEPIAAIIPDSAYAIVRLPDDRLVTPTHALLTLVAALSVPGKAHSPVKDLVDVTRALLECRPQAPYDASTFTTMAVGALIAAARAGIVPEELHTAITDMLFTDMPILSPDQDSLIARDRLQSVLYRLIEDLAPTTPTPPAPAASPPPAPSPAASSPATPATPPAAP